MHRSNYSGCWKARIAREMQSFRIDSTVADSPRQTFFLVFCSQIVTMVVLEAVQTNFDHFYNHNRRGITKYNSFSSALIPGNKRRKEERVVLLGENVFFLHLCLFSDRSLKLFVSSGKTKVLSVISSYSLLHLVFVLFLFSTFLYAL